MMVSDLSKLLVPASLQGVSEGIRPQPLWVQILTIKVSEDKGSNATAKGVISDSHNHMLAVYQGEVATRLAERGVGTNWLVPLTHYGFVSRAGKNLIVIKAADVKDARPHDVRIGNPVAYEPSAHSSNNQNGSINTNIIQSDNKNQINTNGNHNPNAYEEKPNVSKSNPFQTNIKTAEVLDSNVQLIASLTPYNASWTIKARVTNKTGIRAFTNAKGEGKLFSVTLVDSSGEIRATGFGEQVDKFYDAITEGQVYTVSRAQLKNARHQYNVKNEYEMFLSNETSFDLVHGGASDPTIPNLRFEFHPISAIENMEKDTSCDLIGIVRDVGILGSIVTKRDQRSLSKREVTLEDSSGCSIRLTLWGKDAEDFSERPNYYPIVAIKEARISDYNGRTISTSVGGRLLINPDIPEAYAQRGWFDSKGIHMTPRSLSGANVIKSSNKGVNIEERKTIGDLTSGGESGVLDERGEYSHVQATVSYIKEDGNMFYTACPTEGCARKVTEEGGGLFRCDRCQVSHDRCDYRYILSFQISDSSGQLWVSSFNDVGEIVLGVKAEEMHYLNTSDRDAYMAKIRGTLQKQYNFRIRTKQEMYNGDSKIKYTVINASPVDPQEESERIINALDL